MANCITNTVMVIGAMAEVLRFREVVRGNKTAFSCRAVIPIPEGLSNEVEWAIENWGVKRDVWDVEWHGGGSYTFYQFESANCPPGWVYKRLAGMFPALTISWAWDDAMGCVHGYLTPDSLNGQPYPDEYLADYGSDQDAEPAAEQPGEAPDQDDRKATEQAGDTDGEVVADDEFLEELKRMGG